MATNDLLVSEKLKGINRKTKMPRHLGFFSAKIIQFPVQFFAEMKFYVVLIILKFLLDLSFEAIEP